MQKLTKKGFTLVEVIVGAIIIGLISLSAWVAVTVLTRTGEMSRSRSVAVNLLQQSQEELRRIAQTDTVFDTLENCQFPNPSNPPANTCGLSDISASFPGYSRTVLVSRENGSTELKRVLTTVQWIEYNQAKQLQSVALLSRPPEPLAGNLIGFVASEDQSAVPLSGISIQLASNDTTASYSTTSVDVVDSKGANFNFADFDTGRFILPAGSYTLTVNDDNYFEYTHFEDIIIPSNGEEFVSFELVPKPNDATVFGDVIDQSTGNRINSFSGGRINLYQSSSRQQRQSNQRSYSFNVAFDDSTDQNFTINTHDAFRAGFSYSVLSGGSPSCVFQYNREGFSTSVVQTDNSLVCSNPYNGNSTVDRITLSPGDNLQVDLVVEPVPEVFITGRVVDSLGNPIPNATIRARWPRNDGSYDWRKQGVLQTATTNAAGNFTFSVPAIQGMFPNSGSNNDFLQIWARATVSILSCCDILQNEQRNSPTRYIGPLFPADPVRNIGDLVISVVDEQCGNVEGRIVDDLSSNNLAAVNVTISGSESTDAGGYYIFNCDPATGFRIETGNYRFTGQKSGYYTNQSAGNNQYQRRSSGGRDVQVLTDVLQTYDARLWPIGLGNIEVTVIDQTTGQLMDGVNVVFNPYTGSNIMRTTVAGIANFTNVLETWPPPVLPADGYYNTTIRNHAIEINHDPANYEPHTEVITGFHSGDNLSITIFLKRIGGV